MPAIWLGEGWTAHLSVDQLQKAPDASTHLQWAFRLAVTVTCDSQVERLAYVPSSLPRK